MNDKVTTMARNGLSPKMNAASQKLGDAIHAALDEAQDAGVPIEMVVGMLEMAKAAVFDQCFRVYEPE